MIPHTDWCGTPHRHHSCGTHRHLKPRHAAIWWVENTTMCSMVMESRMQVPKVGKTLWYPSTESWRLRRAQVVVWILGSHPTMYVFILETVSCWSTIYLSFFFCDELHQNLAMFVMICFLRINPTSFNGNHLQGPTMVTTRETQAWSYYMELGRPTNNDKFWCC